MCEECERIIAELPDAIRSNVEELAAELLTFLHKADKIMRDTDKGEPDAAVVTGSYLIGYLSTNILPDVSDTASLMVSCAQGRHGGENVGVAMKHHRQKFRH